MSNREVIVRVTATDIRRGKRFKLSSCAMAQAISRELGHYVWVDNRQFEGCGVKGRLSPDARRFVYDFDQSKHDVRPASFCLTILAPASAGLPERGEKP